MKKAKLFLLACVVGVGLGVCLSVIAATVEGNAQVRPNLTHADTVSLTSPTEAVGTIFTWAVTSGTGDDQMDLLYVEQRTLAATSGENLDLAAGVTNSFGTVLTFARVKMFAVAASSTNLSFITVGGAAANTFTNWVDDATDQVNVQPGGIACFFAPGTNGYGVTATTGDILLITNSTANSLKYDIYIGGASS